MPHSTFSNPILSGFHPDPSICRVEDDYFLVTSTFEYFPGLPIFHSKDLIHWDRIGHALDRPSQLPLTDARPSGGIYAPTIRFHDGLFFIICTNISAGGNFVVTASDPAGPWSEPYWIEGADGIDPSLFFDDDGRCWYIGNGEPDIALYEGHRNLWLQEFDVSNMALIGEKRVVVDGGTDLSKEPIWIEGPHIYKIDGRYILIAAEGGTEEWHSVVVFASDCVTGPYESLGRNPILTNRTLPVERENPITCTGHADLFQTQNGQWWMVLLACRPYLPNSRNLFNTGRETFLVPMKWENGWPLTADSTGNLQTTYQAPNLLEYMVDRDYGAEGDGFIDNFNDATLDGRWLFVRNPEPENYSLSAKPGCLSISPATPSITSQGSPSIVLVRQRSHAFEASVTLHLSVDHPDASAGLAMIQNNTTYFAADVQNSGGSCVVRLLVQDKADQNAKAQVIESINIGNSAAVELKLISDSSAYQFYYRSAGDNHPSEWLKLGSEQDGSILSTTFAGGFVGAMIGLYAIEPQSEHRSIVSFGCFKYTHRKLN